MRNIITTLFTCVLTTTIFASSEIKIIFPDEQTIHARLPSIDSCNIWHIHLRAQISNKELATSEIMELVNKAIDRYVGSQIAQGSSSRIIDHYGYHWKQQRKKEILKALLHEHPEILATLISENQRGS